MSAQPLSGIRARLASFALLLPLLAFGLAGCRHAAMQVIVPVQPSAAEQYAYAKNYQDKARIDLILDDDEFMRQRQVVIQTYEKVAEYFPDDRQFTPLSKLDVIILKCGFDSQIDRLKFSDRERSKVMTSAIDELSALARKYPENDAVQAQSLYLSGQCYMQMKNFVESQKYFKQVRDDYMQSDNATLKALAEHAAALYNQVYTQQ